MADDTKTLAERLRERFDDKLTPLPEHVGQLTMEVGVEHWIEVMRALRDEPEFRFEQLIDVCGVDYLGYGQTEWDTEDVSAEGFSRGVEGLGPGRLKWGESLSTSAPPRRFAVVVHLLSLRHNHRLRLRCFPGDEMPVIPSLVDLWPVANWFEREAFDLYGILFEGHPDLRRLLTDYGFVGHPFRKDFPLIGNVEVRYDVEKRRVVYQPVTIEPRVLVPRVVRHDSRYQQATLERAAPETKP